MSKKINTSKYQFELQKAYYKFNKKLLKQQYFRKKGELKQLQTVSAVEGLITYLRYLRDSMFINEIEFYNYDTANFKGSPVLNLLNYTIEEYEKSQSCINNYFNIDFSKLDNKDLTDIISTKEKDKATFEEAQEKYIEEWQLHWTKFWELAAKCIDLSMYGTTL